MKAKELIKNVMDLKGFTLTMIVEELNRINEAKTTIQNLSNKLNRNTIKFYEVEQILNVMGYSVSPVKIVPDFVDFLPFITDGFPSDLVVKIKDFLYNPQYPISTKTYLRNLMAHGRGDLVYKEIEKAIENTKEEYDNIDNYF